VASGGALSARRLVTLARPAERVVDFYNQRGTAEQSRSGGRGYRAVPSPQVYALAYNLGNFMRTLAMPKAAEPWSLNSLREKLIKIGAKVGSHGATSRSKWPRWRSDGRCPDRS
jgi:hypothetical protein